MDKLIVSLRILIRISLSGCHCLDVIVKYIYLKCALLKCAFHVDLPGMFKIALSRRFQIATSYRRVFLFRGPLFYANVKTSRRPA